MNSRYDCSLHLTQVPCNWAQAQDHALAVTPGFQKEELNDQIEVCPCCYLPIDKHPLNINFSLSQIAVMGHEYPMLFQTIKIVGMMIFFMLLNTGIFMLHDSSLIKEGNPFKEQFQIGLSPIKDNFSSSKFSIVSLVGFLFQIAILFLITLLQSRRVQKKYAQDKEEFICERSILIKNIPKGSQISERIRNLFVTNFDYIQIISILEIHDWSSYKKSSEDLKLAIKNWKLLSTSKEKSEEKIANSLKLIEEAKKMLGEVKKNLMNSKNENFSGNAIVLFSNEKDRSEVLNAYQKGFFNKEKTQASLGTIKFNDAEKILIQDAPLPSQINWINIGECHKKKVAAKRLSILWFVIFSAATFLFLFISELMFGRKLSDQSSSDFECCPVGALILFSIFTYFIAPLVFRKIEEHSYDSSLTQFNTNYTNKYFAYLLISKILIIFLVQCIFCQGIQIEGHQFSKNQMIAYGVVISLTRLFIIDSISFVLLQLIYPKWIIKVIQQKIGVIEKPLTQFQANQSASSPQLQLPPLYSQTLSTLCLCFMSIDLIPFCSLVFPLSLLIFYWINKWNFSRRSSISPNKMSKNYILSMIKLMEVSLLMKPVFNLIITSLETEYFNIAELFMAIFGLAYLILPKQIPLSYCKKILKMENLKEVEKSDKFPQQLRHYYQIEYPLSKNHDELLNHMNKLNIMQNHKKIVFKGPQNASESNFTQNYDEKIRKAPFTQSVCVIPTNEAPLESDRNLTQQI